MRGTHKKSPEAGRGYFGLESKRPFICLSLCIGDFKAGLGAEFVSQRLKEALVSLQKILGEHYDDQILDRVFKEFCLGK